MHADGRRWDSSNCPYRSRRATNDGLRAEHVIGGMLRVRRRRAEEARHRFLVIALPSDGVLYCAIPKVACSSIMSACVDALEIDFPPNEWKPEVFQTHKWDHLFDRRSIVLDDR